MISLQRETKHTMVVATHVTPLLLLYYKIFINFYDYASIDGKLLSKGMRWFV